VFVVVIATILIQLQYINNNENSLSKVRWWQLNG